MENGIPPEQICEEIMMECLSPDLLMTGTDNMTIVLICFLHNKTYEDFCKRAAEYCLRLFPDDEKFSGEKTLDNQSGAVCENGLSPAPAVISHDDDDDEDAEDSSSTSDEDQSKANEQNGEMAASKVENQSEPLENGQKNDKAPDDTNAAQDSKKFKEENVEEEDLK